MRAAYFLPLRGIMNRHRGFTLIEIVMVMALIGIMLAVALPFVRGSSDSGNVGGATSALSSMHAVAKQSAIQRGRLSMLVMTPAQARAWVVSRNAAGTGWDTLGRVEDFSERFGGVAISSTRDTLVFTPRGIGQETSGTTIVISRGAEADTITISAAGRLVR